MLLLLARAVTAQEAALTAYIDEGRVAASILLREAPVERVLSALQDGLKSEIVFELRLYRRLKGFLAWLGDRPVASRRETRVAAFDPFTGRYVVRGEDRAPESFSGQSDFLRHFFALTAYAVGEVEPGEEGRYYVLGRVRLSPVRIIGPLNIVTLLSSDSVVTTDWAEQALGPP